MDALPPGLAGPVPVELARPAEAIPGPAALPGGSVYELKWDGYRLVIVRQGPDVRLWSRHGKDLTARFPDVAAAALEQLGSGTVLDGEVVVWNGDRLDFDPLQQRLVTGAAKAGPLIRRHPASYVAFDVLAHRGDDQRGNAFRRRRVLLEELTRRWRPPLQVSPTTTDLEVARAWFADYRPAGIEGLVVKGADTPYAPGQRDWVKDKSRQTREVIAGAVIWPIQRPHAVVAGLVRDGELVIVGRTVPLDERQAAELAAVLRPAGPGHPWSDHSGAGHFSSSREAVALTRVDLTVVVEVSADVALKAGRFRHPLRYVRHRPDLEPADVAPLQTRAPRKRRDGSSTASAS